jgi:hypothetical protein
MTTLTPYYPGNIAPFTTHVNVTEIIDASHPNKIQVEVVALESTLGTNPALAGAFNGSLTTSSSTSNPNVSSNIYITSGTQFNSVSDRITNVENLAVAAYAAAGAPTQVNNLYALDVFGGI